MLTLTSHIYNVKVDHIGKISVTKYYVTIFIRYYLITSLSTSLGFTLNIKGIAMAIIKIPITYAGLYVSNTSNINPPTTGPSIPPIIPNV